MKKSEGYIKYLKMIRPIMDYATNLQKENVPQEIILECVRKKEAEMKDSIEYKEMIKEFEKEGFVL